MKTLCNTSSLHDVLANSFTSDNHSLLVVQTIEVNIYYSTHLERNPSRSGDDLVLSSSRVRILVDQIDQVERHPEFRYWNTQKRHYSVGMMATSTAIHEGKKD